MRKLLSVGLLAITMLAAAGVPAHAEDTGVIAGRFTDNGAPVPSVFVNAQPDSGPGGKSTLTDSNGEYRIEGLTPGRYRVSFNDFGRPVQYAFGKTSLGDAALITVTAGAVSTVDDSRLPTGLIQGTFNSPVPDSRVTFAPADSSGGGYHQGFVSASGQFSARLLPGRYRVSFHIFHPFPVGAYIQYAGGTDVHAEATVFDLAANGTITINESMLPTGRMEGRFTDAAGNGIPNVEVSISRPDLGRGPSAGTDANGYFSFPHMRVSPSWRVLFNASRQGFQQHAFGKVRAAEADAITITQGQTTIVNDSRLPTGTVKVTAKDAVSGATIEKFQASLDGAGIGETNTSEVTISDVPVGTHPLSVGAYGYEYAENAASVTVTAGGQAEATVLLRPKTRIEAMAVDAATGRPVEGVCLIASQPQRFILPSEHCWEGTTSGPSGRVMTEIQEPGWYQVFAFPMGGQGLGAQWVGPSGGSGSQLGAQLIKVEAGKAAQAPVIKLDRAGTITGQVTSPSGVPVPNAVVSLGDWSTAGPSHGVVHTDEQGRYTLDFLGPYRWPLRFFQYEEFGVQWSGQSGTRHLAQPVTVQSGQTTGYDFRFKAPTRVTTEPKVAGDCEISAFNLLTGDLSGFRYVGDCTQPIVVPMVGPQWVKVRVGYRENGEWKERFHETRFIR